MNESYIFMVIGKVGERTQEYGVIIVKLCKGYIMEYIHGSDQLLTLLTFLSLN